MFKYANNAIGNLAASIGPTDTQLALSGAQFFLFPIISAPDIFYVTITDSATKLLIEICAVTNTSSHIFTIVRGQDGTTPRSWNANDIVSLRAISLQYSDFLSKTFGGTISDAVVINSTLEVSGNIQASSFNVSSDYRNKYNVTPIVNAIDKLTCLNPVKYNFMKEDYKRSGFLAHEVQDHFPEMVTGEKDSVKEFQTLDYIQLIPWLVSAICDLNELVRKKIRIDKIEKLEESRLNNNFISKKRK